ncbi:hypothetical protein L1887_56343 [Cichorium endivia]|nr:hypothetical protein L1887_56343 [Cichorium endivia]
MQSLCCPGHSRMQSLETRSAVDGLSSTPAHLTKTPVAPGPFLPPRVHAGDHDQARPYGKDPSKHARPCASIVCSHVVSAVAWLCSQVHPLPVILLVSTAALLQAMSKRDCNAYAVFLWCGDDLFEDGLGLSSGYR